MSMEQVENRLASISQAGTISATQRQGLRGKSQDRIIIRSLYYKKSTPGEHHSTNRANTPPDTAESALHREDGVNDNCGGTQTGDNTAFRKTIQNNFHVLSKSRKYGDPTRVRTIYTDSKISTATTFKNFKNFASPTQIQSPFFLNFTMPDRTAIRIDDQGQPIHNEIPNEDTIRAEYEFKLPVIVGKQENPRVVGHFLESVVGPMKLVEDLIRTAERMTKNYSALKDDLKKDITEIRTRHTSELTEINEKYLPMIVAYIRRMKDDFVAQQNENFKLQKEIALYKRDLLAYEEDVDREKARLKELEMNIFGMEVYDLQTDVQYLEQIPEQSLRAASQKGLEYKPVFH